MNSMRKKKIVRYLGIILLVALGMFIFLFLTGTLAHAAGLVDDTVDAVNQYSKYPLENYQLDFYVDSSWDWLPWNWLDGIGKNIQYGLYAITNFVWIVSLYIANATGYVVQEAYKLDFISDTASAIGKNIQTLAGISQNGFSTEGFYVGFLLIFILILGIYVAYTGLIKRETTKAIHAVVNFLVVFLLSVSFIAYAPDYIEKINDFSSDISTAALSLGTKIVLPNSDNQGKDSVDLIRDSLFAIQVKQPWLLLQYDESDIEKLGSARVESLLSASPNTDDREKAVIEEIENKDNGNLSVTKTMARLGMVVFLFIFNIGISVFVFMLTGMMIFSQVLFIIYAMFLPISFVLSMLPTYEGMAKKALTKLFNTIMLRSGITLILTTAFSIFAMFYAMSTGYPFFMVAFLQIVTFAGIYYKMNDLMGMFSLQSGDTQQVGGRIMRRPYNFMNRSARRLERKIGRSVVSGAAGGIAGAAVVSSSRKGDSAKRNNPARPNRETGSVTSSLGKRAGAKVGGMLDTKDQVKDKAKMVKQQIRDTPTKARYIAYSGKKQVRENVSDFKRGIVEEQTSRKEGRENEQAKYRQTLAQRRMQLDEAKKRPVAKNEKPQYTGKEFDKKQRENVRLQDSNQMRAVAGQQFSSAKKLSGVETETRKRPVAVRSKQPQVAKVEAIDALQQKDVRMQVAERKKNPSTKQSAPTTKKQDTITKKVSRQTIERKK